MYLVVLFSAYYCSLFVTGDAIFFQ